MDCLFCKIVAGDIPVEKLYEDEDVIALWDIAPQAPQHFLVIPKEHISGPASVTTGNEQLVGKMIRVAGELAAANNIGDNFRLVMNNGEEAGQTVFHIHLHVLGGRAMQWPPG